MSPSAPRRRTGSRWWRWTSMVVGRAKSSRGRRDGVVWDSGFREGSAGFVWLGRAHGARDGSANGGDDKDVPELSVYGFPGNASITRRFRSNEHTTTQISFCRDGSPSPASSSLPPKQPIRGKKLRIDAGAKAQTPSSTTTAKKRSHGATSSVRGDPAGKIEPDERVKQLMERNNLELHASEMDGWCWFESAGAGLGKSKQEMRQWMAKTMRGARFSPILQVRPPPPPPDLTSNRHALMIFFAVTRRVGSADLEATRRSGLTLASSLLARI